MNRSLVGIALLALVCTACGGSTSAHSRPAWVRAGAYAPAIRPADFVAAVTNRYFPLVPGTQYRYAGHKGKTPQSDVVLVSHAVKRILGIRATVVRDTVFQRRRPVERRFDWYAQDRHGNVWYLGQRVLQRRHRRWVRAGDSWTAGVNGAKAGIVMRGHPLLGDRYRLDAFRRAGTPDQARVAGMHPLTTVQWSPAEPQLERKVYVAGVGEISERRGNEALELVSVTRGVLG